MQVVPAASRHTLIDSGQSLIFSIPSRRQWAVVLFLCFWSVGWFFGEFTAIAALLSGKAGGGSGFTVVWLGAWTVGGIVAIYQLIWLIAGKEVLLVTSASVTLKRQIFNIGIPKIYATEYIKDLRAVGPVNRSQWSRSSWNNAEGSMAFDYGAKTIRFASGIDEAEGKQIVAKIHQRFSNVA